VGPSGADSFVGLVVGLSGPGGGFVVWFGVGEVGQDVVDPGGGGQVGQVGVGAAVGDGCRDVPEFDVVVLGVPAQQGECLVLVHALGDHQGALGLFDGGAGADGVVHGLPGGLGQVAAQGIGDVDEVAVEVRGPAVPVLLALAEGDDGVDSPLRVQDPVAGAERFPGGDRGGDQLDRAGPVIWVLMGAMSAVVGTTCPGW